MVAQASQLLFAFYMSQTQHLPHVTVQPDWQAVTEDLLGNKTKKESFWISCYCKCMYVFAAAIKFEADINEFA